MTDYYPFGSERNSASSKEYRWNLQGQEKDSETGLIVYKYRMYDPQTGRFKSTDPLEPKYPWNSSYAFSENRVIDGVELEGLEYASIIRKHHEGNLKPKITVVWHDETQHNSHGSLGMGVMVVNEYYFANGKMFQTDSRMHRREAKLPWAARQISPYIYSDYGFYYGGTQLPTVSQVSNYTLTAIDAVDEGARMHDIGYDYLKANGQGALDNDWGVTPVDEAAIRSWKEVVVRGIGGIDPFNGQPISANEYYAAKNGVQYFEWVVWDKIEASATFMRKHFPDMTKKNSSWYGNDIEDNQRYNYQMFLKTYMHQDKQGNWQRNKGMWVNKGTEEQSDWQPVAPEE